MPVDSGTRCTRSDLGMFVTSRYDLRYRDRFSGALLLQSGERALTLYVPYVRSNLTILLGSPLFEPCDNLILASQQSSQTRREPPQFSDPPQHERTVKYWPESRVTVRILSPKVIQTEEKYQIVHRLRGHTQHGTELGLPSPESVAQSPRREMLARKGLDRASEFGKRFPRPRLFLFLVPSLFIGSRR